RSRCGRRARSKRPGWTRRATSRNGVPRNGTPPMPSHPPFRTNGRMRPAAARDSGRVARSHRDLRVPTLGPCTGPQPTRASRGGGTGDRRSGLRARGGGVAGEVRGRLCPAGDLELGQDARDVVLHGLLCQVELVADLLVGLAVGDGGEDSLLLRGEPGELLVLQQVLALT